MNDQNTNSSTSSIESIESSNVIDNDETFTNSFGLKSIGKIGGICLLIGNCTGPGMVNISYQFQQGGWFLSILGYILMLVLSGLSALFIVESMSMIPGNNKFQLRVEFTTICRFYFGKWMYVISQLFINSSLMITNIASIIICCQISDNLLLVLFKKTCGLSLTQRDWICITHHSSLDIVNTDSSPFSNDYMFFTFGFLLIIALILPLGFMNLNDNIIIQIICVLIMFIIVVFWIIMLSIIGLGGGDTGGNDNLPVIGSMSGISQIIGNCMFNYAYITTIPSWVNESKPKVNLKYSIWISTGFSTVLFIFIGVFGALAFGSMSSNSNILSLINSSSKSNIISKISIYLFPFVVLASTIPVFSIIIRYNLTNINLTSKSKILKNNNSKTIVPTINGATTSTDTTTSTETNNNKEEINEIHLNNRKKKWIINFISIILPWILVLPFQTGDWLNIISNYSSLFFASVANFIIPFLLYIKSIQFKKNNNQHDHSTIDQQIVLKELLSEKQKLEKQQKQKQQQQIDNHKENKEESNESNENHEDDDDDETIEEDHDNITSFKSLSGIPLKYSKLIAQISLILLIILIIIVIFSNFYFINND